MWFLNQLKLPGGVKRNSFFPNRTQRTQTSHTTALSQVKKTASKRRECSERDPRISGTWALHAFGDCPDEKWDVIYEASSMDEKGWLSPLRVFENTHVPSFQYLLPSPSLWRKVLPSDQRMDTSQTTWSGPSCPWGCISNTSASPVILPQYVQKLYLKQELTHVPHCIV